MTHFALLWKARTIEKHRQNYENEKINSIIMSNADIPDKTLRQRWKHYSHDVQKRLSRSFSKWYPEGSNVSNFFVSLKTDMRLPTILLRSLYGFVGGLLLTYLGFMFFVFQLSLSLMNATVLSSVLGVLLTLGLTFSNRMRCIIFLLIPQLFSRVGRYTLTCYALVLILTGPATNTLKNSEVLSESMACSQEQLKLSVRDINDSIRKPFNSMNDSLKITIGSIKLIVRKLKIALIRINRLILSIASVIQSGFAWLDSVANICNEALGPPHDKCFNYLQDNFQTHFEQHMKQAKPKNVKRTFRGDLENLLDAIGVKDFKRHKGKEQIKEFTRFKAKKEIKAFNEPNNEKERDMGGLKAKNDKRSNIKKDQEWFNNAAYIAKIACGSLKSYDKFCVPADFTEETFLATIRQKLKTFTHRLSSLLYVKLNIHHTYTYIGNSSSINLVQTGIVTEIRNRADPLLTWLSWSSCVTSLFLLLIIFRAKHYQLMFETRPRFDNRFITKEFRELDLKRLREGKATVLPLNKRERAKYVTTTSFRLVASEKFHLNRSAVFMTIATFKLLIHIVADYSLYWVLMTIQHHGKQQTPLPPGIPDTGGFISGVGFVSRLLQSFLDTLNLQLSLPPPDSSCLPNPYPPDFKRYCQIGFLIFLLWFFAIFEPYGLRVRHLIMGHHRPERAKDRAEWLYNHILKNRASFMKFARRRLHREYKYYSSHAKLTCHYWLRTHIPFYWLRSLLGIKPEEPVCLLCHTTKDTSDSDKELIKCEVPNCPGTYCTSCFSDIGQLCTICLSPSDYGDLSDVSLVKDDEDDSDSEGNNYNGPDNNNLSDDKTSNSDDGGNTTDGEYDDASLLLALGKYRASNYGKQKQDQYLLGKNNKSEKFTILLLANEVQVLVRKNECKLLRQYVKPRFTKFPNCFENIETFKDLNNNNIDTYNIKTIESYQYSAYKITRNPFDIKKAENTTRFAKYLRKKNIIRCKLKDSNKNLKYFMTCSNNNINITSERTMNIAGNYDPARDANNLKNTKGKTKTCKFTSKNDDSKKTNLPDKQSYPKNDNIKFKTKEAKMKSRTFHTTFSKYWKLLKFTILPCTCLTNTKRNLPPIKEKKHKRKKKRNKSKNRQLDIKSKLNENVEITENSRLFAYLDDRDWVQNIDKSPKQKNIVTAQVAIEKHARRVDDDMIVNNVLIPRLNLNLSSNSTIFEQQINSVICENSKNVSNFTRRIDYAKSALDRFFKSIVDKTNNLLVTTSNEVVKSKLNSMHLNKSFGPRADSNSTTSRDSRVDVKEFRLKRVSSSFFSGYKLSRPLSILKVVYPSSLTCKSSAKVVDKKSKKQQKKDKNNKEENNEKGIKRKDKKIRSNDKTLQTRAVIIKEIEKTNEKKIQTINDYQDDKEIQTFNLMEDKAVTVMPMTNKSRGCQKDCGCSSTQECGVQVTRTPVPRSCDEEVMATKQTCTCATQYKLDKDECTCISEICRDNAKISGTGFCTDSLTESSSIESEGSRTDTTVCSLANVEYRKDDNRSNKDKVHTKVVTKSNKSTLTDKARYYDVSTATYDWWSPIVEKKNLPKKEDKRRYESRRKYCDTRRERVKVYKTRGMSTTGEKMVQFRSRALLIPSNESGPSDMLTPLRYLLDSQKHYNELYATKFNLPQVYPVTNSQKYQNQEKDRSQVSRRHHSLRVRKSKRLEESYSPRKQASPRKRRGLEFVRAQELSKIIRRNKPKN